MPPLTNLPSFTTGDFWNSILTISLKLPASQIKIKRHHDGHWQLQTDKRYLRT